MPYLAMVVAAAITSPAATSSPTATPAPATLSSPTPNKRDLREIGNVVVTADRRPTPLSETVKPTYEVTRQDIENYGYDTIGEAIQNVPGEQFLRYGAFGSQVGYGAMGAPSTATTVLLDGVPITDGSDGIVNLGTLSTNGVERIEVVESGGSVLYGSGASGGVINIITSVPRSAYLAVSYGAFGDQELRVADGNGTIGISLERHIAANTYPYAAQSGITGGIRSNDQGLQSDAQLSYRQKVGHYTINASGRTSQIDIGVPGPINGLSPFDNDATSRNDIVADISRVDGKYTSSVTVSALRQNGFFNQVSAGGTSFLTDSRSGINFKEIVTGHGNDALVAGVDLQRENALYNLGPAGPPPEFAAAQSQSAGYLQQSWGLGPDGKVYAGLRAEHDSPAGSVLDPGAGVLVPWGNLRIAANGAESYIVPTLIDLYYPGASNPNLIPEKDRNFDLNFSLPKARIVPTISFFDRSAHDLITYTSNFTPINAGTGHFQGATATVQTKVMHGLEGTVSLTDLWLAEQSVQGLASRVDFEPLFQGFVSLEHPMGVSRLAYGTTVHFSGAHTESFNGPGQFGSYTAGDLYVRYKLSEHGILSLQEKNVGNNTNGLYDYYPQPGRQYRIEYSTR